VSGEPNLRETRYVLASGWSRARYMWEERREEVNPYISIQSKVLATYLKWRNN
jgi:hypothetical protein